jgi:hypothetical protein
MTGSMPGMAASTSETLAFGALPNSVEAPEKSLELDFPIAGGAGDEAFLIGGADVDEGHFRLLLCCLRCCLGRTYGQAAQGFQRVRPAAISQVARMTG